MPTSFASYDLDHNGSISSDEWTNFYPIDEGPASGGPSGGDQPFDVTKALDFFNQITSAFGDSGFEFTPELLESMGTILPAMGMYSEFSKAQYQQDALDYMREELGLKGAELDLAREQMKFEQGPAWDWYKNEFFPMSIENQRLEFETQKYLMQGQKDVADQETAQALQRTLQAQEGTSQARESTKQSRIASEIARYNALSQLGAGKATRSADGRSVRGSAFTYGYGNGNY